MIIFIKNKSTKFCQTALRIKRFMHKRKVVPFFCLTMYIQKVHFHYPRDVIYARVLAMALCLSVRPSVSLYLSVAISLSQVGVLETDGRIELFGMEASFDKSCTVL